MKLRYVLLILSFVFGYCSKEIVVNHEFVFDLGSENNKIAGELYWDKYNNNLETLTYTDYINYIKSNVSYSAKGTPEKIVKAKKYYFESVKESFLLVLYYDSENTVICDNSSTPKIDSVITYSNEVEVPPLSKFSFMLNK